MIEAEETTKRTYRGYLDKHVRPLIGGEKVGAIDADILDSFYAELRRCRDHCRGRPTVKHHTVGKHECDKRCRRHKCKPLAAWTIRKIHFIISGAYKRAVRWKWVSVNPAPNAEPPSAPPPDPQPPSAEDAARILKEAWKDPDFGPLIWLAMTTGARRGELCAVRWSSFKPTRKVLELEKSIAQDGSETWEKDTKTHQRRHVALDPETVAVLTEHRERCEGRAAALGVALAPDAYIFSPSPDSALSLKPASVTPRYYRLAERMEINTTLHKLRHYSATELISAGVDIRTVAGRLGHAGGGTTTLKVYAAWVSEADQRASTALMSRMPARPAPPPAPADRAKVYPRSPFEKVAAELRIAILAGAIAAGDELPTIKDLAAIYEMSVGTAHRAVTLLKTWDLIEVSRGRRAIVQPIDDQVSAPNNATDELESSVDVSMPDANDGLGGSTVARRLLDLELKHNGEVVKKLTTEADPKDPRELRQLMLDAIKRNGGDEHYIAEYEMDIHRAGERHVLITFVTTARN